jgi:hypothetical protein
MNVVNEGRGLVKSETQWKRESEVPLIGIEGVCRKGLHAGELRERSSVPQVGSVRLWAVFLNGSYVQWR